MGHEQEGTGKVLERVREAVEAREIEVVVGLVQGDDGQRASVREGLGLKTSWSPEGRAGG